MPPVPPVASAPPVGGAPGDTDVLTVELDPAEAATGVVKAVTLPDGQTLTMRVPPGVRDNSVLRLPGARPDPAGGAPYDALVRIRVTGMSAPGGPFLPPYAQQGPYFPPPPPPPTKSGNRSKLIIAGAVALVLVLCVGCGVTALVTSSHKSNSTNGSGTGTSTVDSPSPSPSPTPLSPDAYQQELATMDTALTPLMQAINAAANAAAIKSAATQLATQISVQRQQLQSATVPANVEAGNTEMVQALTQLESQTEDISTEGSSQGVCVGQTAMSELTASASATAVRTAAQHLAAADPAHAYKVGGFMPAPVSAPATKRLGNGTIVKKASKSGSGQLKIQNGGTDAALSLVPKGTNSAMVTVYVQANAAYTLKNIHDGTYTIFYTAGTDWDPNRKIFTKSCQYQQFDDTLDFATTSTQYTIWTITMTPTVGGNAQTSDVDPGSFPS
jgi:hypothetical protein